MPDDTRPIIRGFEHHHGTADENPLPMLATRPDGFLDCLHTDFEDLAERPEAYGWPCAETLLQAVDAGEMQAAFIMPGEKRPGLKATYADRRPHLVMFSDLKPREGGPGRFPLAGAVMRWGYGLVICAGPMDPERAGFILAFAGRLQRSAAVITTPERAEAWASFAGEATAPRELRCVTLRPGEPLPKISTTPARGGRK